MSESATLSVRRGMAEFEARSGRKPTRVVMAPDVRRALISEARAKRYYEPGAVSGPITFETRADLPAGMVYCE